MKTTLKAIALLAGTCAGTFASRAEITTGWLPTEA